VNAASGSQANWHAQEGQVPFPSTSWQHATNGAEQQVPFPSTFWQGSTNAAEPQMPFPQAPYTGNLWMQVMSPLDGQQPAAQQSLVPYQEPQQQSPQSLMVLPNGFPTINTGMQAANPLLPALPEGEEQPVYIAPHYTKPRPIIPRYRAISGLISVIIVCALLCGGAGYYAQATGKLVFLQKMFGDYTPPKISVNQNMLKVPTTQVTYGPAANIIPSAAISNKIDPNTYQVASYVNQFTVDETIWVVCSINNAPQSGKVLTKWYTNGNEYRSLLSQNPVAAKTAITAEFSISYGQPAEGKVEIYWTDVNGNNPQLAATLLFVVEPQA
jgi:hypothetical protein